MVLDDNTTTVTPNPDPFRADFGLRRAVYNYADHTLTIDLVEGRQVTVELGGTHNVQPLAGRKIVYLDQNKWITLAQHLHTPHKNSTAENEAAATVIEWVRTRKVVLPLSAAHTAEIGSARPRY